MPFKSDKQRKYVMFKITGPYARRLSKSHQVGLSDVAGLRSIGRAPEVLLGKDVFAHYLPLHQVIHTKFDPRSTKFGDQYTLRHEIGHHVFEDLPVSTKLEVLSAVLAADIDTRTLTLKSPAYSGYGRVAHEEFANAYATYRRQRVFAKKSGIPVMNSLSYLSPRDRKLRGALALALRVRRNQLKQQKKLK